MTETLQTRVNIMLGYTCEGRCMDKTCEFSIPVSAQEKELLTTLPSCENGKTTELKSIIPESLYNRMRDAALHQVENAIYLHGFRSGLYEVDAHKWYEKDLENECFCHCVGNGEYKVEGSDDIYYKDDDGLFELWHEYEDQQVELRGIDYIRERYESELAEQTDLSSISWSMEF